MNLYVHFPFCRAKCVYCALFSRANRPLEERAAYVEALARQITSLVSDPASIDTLYFGGGSPCLCDLRPLFAVLKDRLSPGCEFTVEVHPKDVSDGLISMLADGGVNRISMGVQSLDEAALRSMGRAYAVADAARAFEVVKRHIDNAGIDLIAGYPGDRTDADDVARLGSWGIEHASCYSLILEPGTALARMVERGRVSIPDDDSALDKLARYSAALASIGLERYEISNYARPGRRCAHNMAVWRGEDYIGLGEGAFGRVGLERTECICVDKPPRREMLSAEADKVERTIFRLRTCEGLDASAFPQWRDALERFMEEGVLEGAWPRYFLTARGQEVCDTVLAELVP